MRRPDGKDPRLTNSVLSPLVTFSEHDDCAVCPVLPLIGSGAYRGPVLHSTGVWLALPAASSWMRLKIFVEFGGIAG